MRNFLNTIIKIFITFIIVFIIVGYAKNGISIKIDWVDGTSIWDKFKWYYCYNFIDNSLLAFPLTIFIYFMKFFISKRKYIKKFFE